MNEYDSNRIYDLVSTIGYEKTDFKKKANCLVLNTCHIREKATEKVYDEVGRIKKEFRNSKKPLVIISGCVAQAESEEMLKREPFIDIGVGPQSYHKINDLILNYYRESKKINLTDFDTVNKFDKLESIGHSVNKTSSYITIQEGCDKFCNFCVVPYTRGPEYSRPFNQIINEAETLVNNGAKEIVLLGQNVNAYNFTNTKMNFRLSHLLIALNKIKKLERIRFTTSHPKDMSEDLIKCYSECTKLMPFLHLPIQSGSNKILKLMNRKHTREYYLSIIKKLKEINNKIKFSSDFIVGYPEETEDDFNETLDLVNLVGFINSYSFIFSPRPGTPAMEKKLNNKNQNKERLNKLQNLLSNIQIQENKKFENKHCEVLVENKITNQNKFFGRNKHMTPVIFTSNNSKIGSITNVKIESSNRNTLFGSEINNKIEAA